jgi:predicted 3-demethylubiquinone-9 3-methyltransferase (glyoxalase superfamily)
MSLVQKITPYLWYESQALEAAQFYVSVFPGSRITDENPVLVGFELSGTAFFALNGGPHDRFNDAVSLYVHCEDQVEVDGFWNALVAGGGTWGRCGWLKDRFGLSWQIVPGALGRYLSSGTPDQSRRVMEAMMGMDKLEVAGLKAAFEG